MTTLRELTAEVCSPTHREIPQDSRLTGEQTVPDMGAIPRAVLADDLRHLQHDDLCDRSEVVHQLVQRIGQRGANLAREMRVDLDRPRAAMAQGVLDDPQIDAGFQ